MKQNGLKRISLILALLVITLAGCGQRGAERAPDPSSSSTTSSKTSSDLPSSSAASEPEEAGDADSSAGEPADAAPESDPVAEPESDENVPAEESNAAALAGTDLTVRFGDGGAPFAMHLYDNPTAAAIAGYVGSADWRLPIYHYDDFEHSDVMQYYDIPSRYEIPSAPEAVTSEKAGEVFYSDPNRIVLFYHDAEVSGEYTRIGYFDATQEFVAAVEQNPVLEGWGNKIVNISPAE